MASKNGSNGKNGSHENGKFRITYLEVIETDQNVTLMADMPGENEDPLALSVDRGVLNLSGRIDFGEGSEPRFRQCVLGDFFRLFRLSHDVDRDRVSAGIEDGILKLTIPKSERELGPRLGFRPVRGKSQKKRAPANGSV